jgi:hypothetical protein
VFEAVRRLPGKRWAHEQIALTLAARYPGGHEYRVSTETNYNCIYAQPVADCKLERVACECGRHAPSVQ